MSKALHKAIMKRSKLKYTFNKDRNIENWSEHKQHSNYCSHLLKQPKKHHSKKLTVKDLSENKQF